MALQKDRNLRYQTAAGIPADLLAYKSSVGAGQVPSPPRGVPIPDAGTARAEEGLWVAVLPLKVTASDKELESLADGLTEDVTAGLSRFPYLRVVAYNSAMTYKSRSIDIRAVDRELGARYVVEGSIRKRGRALRINAQLVDAMSGVQLWAETYNRELADGGPFETLDDVTDRIIATVADGHGVLVRSMATATRESPWKRRAHRNWYRGGSRTSCNSKLRSTPGSVRPSSGTRPRTQPCKRLGLSFQPILLGICAPSKSVGKTNGARSRSCLACRPIPAANSGLRSPVSAASCASRPTAAKRTLIVEGARFFYSRKNLKYDTRVEGQARLGTVPTHEFLDGISIRFLRTGRLRVS